MGGRKPRCRGKKGPSGLDSAGRETRSSKAGLWAACSELSASGMGGKRPLEWQVG